MQVEVIGSEAPLATSTVFRERCLPHLTVRDGLMFRTCCKQWRLNRHVSESKPSPNYCCMGWHGSHGELRGWLTIPSSYAGCRIRLCCKRLQGRVTCSPVSGRSLRGRLITSKDGVSIFVSCYTASDDERSRTRRLLEENAVMLSALCCSWCRVPPPSCKHS
jgi:hypothetical protein